MSRLSRPVLTSAILLCVQNPFSVNRKRTGTFRAWHVQWQVPRTGQKNVQSAFFPLLTTNRGYLSNSLQRLITVTWVAGSNGLYIYWVLITSPNLRTFLSVNPTVLNSFWVSLELGLNPTQEKQYSNNDSTSFKEGNKTSLLLGNRFCFIKLIDYIELPMFSLVS